MTIHETLQTIPNRFAFIDAVNKQAQKHEHLALMLVDVVRFSDVTTSFGVAIGDQFLLEIANRIAHLFDGRITLGRISGDVFGLIFNGYQSPASMKREYEFLIEHFKTPMYHKDHAFIADFNVGTVIRNGGSFDLSSFVAKGEAALKQAKDNQYDNFHVFDIQEKSETGRSLALKADLKRAIDNEELELYLQPKVNLDSLEISSAECLLRWNHPLDGVLFPGALIEAAESYNMINTLAYWTLEQAFRILVTLGEKGIDIPISVNISPTQLYDNKLIPRLKELQAQYGVPFSRLELELTEDIALSNSLMVKSQLSQLHALDIAISIDDFGKGYSNLAYVRELEIGGLKIDKSFVMELDENPVNKAIIVAAKVIADAKQCEVVAEGIETVNQLHILRELGIPKGQGYLFSPAIPIDSFIDFARQDLIIGSSPLRKALNN